MQFFFLVEKSDRKKVNGIITPLLTHLIICLAMAHPGLGFDCLAVVFVQKFGDYASVT